MARPCAIATAVSETATTSPACAIPATASATMRGDVVAGADQPRAHRDRDDGAARAVGDVERAVDAERTDDADASACTIAQPLDDFLELVRARALEQHDVAGARVARSQRDRVVRCDRSGRAVGGSSPAARAPRSRSAAKSPPTSSAVEPAPAAAAPTRSCISPAASPSSAIPPSTAMRRVGALARERFERGERPAHRRVVRVVRSRRSRRCACARSALPASASPVIAGATARARRAPSASAAAQRGGDVARGCDRRASR